MKSKANNNGSVFMCSSLVRAASIWLVGIMMVFFAIGLYNKAIAAHLQPAVREAKFNRLYTQSIRQLNLGQLDKFSSDYKHAITLAKPDFQLSKKLSLASISQAKKLIADKQLSKAELLLSAGLPLDQYAGGDVVKCLMIVLANEGKYDGVDSALNEYFRLMLKENGLYTHLNLDKAQLYTFAGRVLEKESQMDRAERLYRMAIRETVKPVEQLEEPTEDKSIDQAYYWARIVAQARLGELLVKKGQTDDGTAILSMVKEILKQNNSPAQLKFSSDSLGEDPILAGSWVNDRHKAYAVLNMPDKFLDDTQK